MDSITLKGYFGIIIPIRIRPMVIILYINFCLRLF